MQNNLNIWIYGAGALGCYYGVRLLQAGHAVSFIGRGEHLKALKNNGLNLESCDGNFSSSRILAFSEDELIKITKPNLVIVSSKRASNEAIAKSLQSLIDEQTPCYILQNGLKSQDIFKQALNPKQIFRAIANITVRVSSPGKILHTAGGALILEAGHHFCDKLIESFQKTGVKCKSSQNIQEDIWSKIIWNAPFNSITALTGLSTTPILTDADGLKLVQKIAEEVYSLAITSGVNLPKSIIQEKIDFTLKQLGNVSTSTLEDVKLGKPIEYEAIVGDLIEEAKRLNIEVPHLESVFILLKLLNNRLTQQAIR